MAADGRPGWWSRWPVLLALLVAAALPLLGPDVPPLTDLPGHIGRYRVELDLAGSPALQRFYSFDWALLGNLGVDLLVVPLAALFGLEPAVKTIVVAIPVLTVAGLLLVARQVHGRVPPTALFALPFAYSYPLHFGFVNFALSMALALLALALWLRLADAPRLRASLFGPLSMILWVCHIFGWGLLGLLAFAAEWDRQGKRGRGPVAAAIRAGVHCLALAPPLVLMILWRSGDAAGNTGDWFNMSVKTLFLFRALADRWAIFDLLAIGVVLALLFAAWRSRSLGFSRTLGVGALLLALVYVALPRVLLGSAYADMRLAPYMLAVAVLAIRPNEEASANVVRTLALAGLAFVVARTAGNLLSLAAYDRSWSREIAALDHVPRGARVFALVGKRCSRDWATTRFDHLPGLAIARREAFSNDQWTLAGAQLLRVRLPAPGFRSDPSQLVLPAGCPHPEWRPIDRALASFPRERFDYLWLIDPPGHDPRLVSDLAPVWRRGTSMLYRLGASPSAARRPASR